MKAYTEKKTVKASRYDWSSLTNNDDRNQYPKTARNSFDTLQQTFEIHTTDNEYEDFVTTHIEDAAEYIPIKLKPKCKVKWESIAIRKKRDVTIHRRPTPTISTIQNTHGHQNCLVVFLISGQGYFTFLYQHTKHNIHNREGGRKEEQAITGLG